MNQSTVHRRIERGAITPTATALYAAEVAEYVANYGPPMHFKRWLTESRGQAR